MKIITTNQISRIAVSTAVLLSSLLFSQASISAITDEDQKTPAKNEQSLNYGTQGMKVYRDPETGKITMPPPSLRGISKALENNLSRSSEGLKERVLPNGAVELNLQGRFMNMSVARIEDNGLLNTQCGLNLEAAVSFMGQETMKAVDVEVNDE